MAILTQARNLNLIPGIQAPTVVHLSAGNNGDTIKFYLFEGNNVFIASGYTVSVHGIRADGAVFGPYPVTTVDDSNEVSFAVRREMTAVSGPVVAELTIATNSAIIGTTNFYMLVETAAFPNGVTYDTDPSVYQQILAYAQTAVAGIQSSVDALKSAVGSPLVASTHSAMTDTNKVYVYTGSESGYTAGNWYYYNGTAWVSGGVYNSVALSTDKTLTVAEKAADARMTGSGIDGVSARIGDAYGIGVDIAPPTTQNTGNILTAAKNTVFTHDSYANVQHGYLSVTPGDRYVVTSYMTATGATNGYFALVATDSSNVVLDAVQYTNVESGATTNEIIIPGKATRLWIVCYASTAAQYKALTKVVRYAKITLADEVTTVGGKYYKSVRNIDMSANLVVGKRLLPTLSIGDTISDTTNANLCYSYTQVTAGQSYRVTVRESTSLEGYWVYLTTSGAVVRQMLMPKSDNPISQIPNTAIITIPENMGISRMYVQSYVNNETNFARFTKVEQMEVYSVSDGVGNVADDLHRKIYRTTGEVMDLSTHLTVGEVFDADAFGAALTASQSPAYSHSWVAVTGGEAYKVTTRASGNYARHWVYFTNNNDIIVGYAMPGHFIGANIAEFVDVPVGATRMHILSYSNNDINFNRNTSCERAEAIDQLDLTEALAQEENVIDNLPAYYTPSWIQTRMDAVMSVSQITSGVVFGFITDTHMQANDGYSKYLAKAVLDKTSVPFFIFGGDTCRAYGTREEMEADADAWLDWVKYVGKVYQIRGNHDYNVKTSADADTGYTETNQYAYNLLMRPQELEVIGGTSLLRMFWMIDNPIQKVRIIGTDCFSAETPGAHPWSVLHGMPQAEYDWISDRINEVEGYGFVFIVHAAPDPSGTIPSSGGNAGLFEIERAINNHDRAVYSGTYGMETITVNEDFTNTTNYVICNLSGHNHKDRSNVYQNVLSITTTSDAHYNDDPDVTRTTGTPTAQAFDIFAIDTTARTIKTVRFGGGVNRSWNY